MKKFIALLIVLGTLFVSAEEAEKSYDTKKEHYSFNLSVFHPLSLNKSKDDTANINLSLIYGHVGQVEGADLSLLTTFVKNDVTGVQLGGLFAYTGGNITGIQWSDLAVVTEGRVLGFQSGGIFSYAGGNVTGGQSGGILNIGRGNLVGVQAAGIANYNEKDITGAQASGIVNVNNGDFTGAQLAGIGNYNGKALTGAQVSGIGNINNRDLTGAQISGIFNYSGGVVTGTQISPIANISSGLDGFQLGLVNISGNTTGVQLGLVNIAKEMKGVPIGLINIAENGEVNPVVFASNTTLANIGVKFSVGYIYSMLTLGSYNLSEKESQSLSAGFYYGGHLPLGKFYFDGDLGAEAVDNKELFDDRQDDSDDPIKDSYSLRTRITAGFDITDWLGVFAGGGMEYKINEREKFKDGSFSPLFFGGVKLF